MTNLLKISLLLKCAVIAVACSQPVASDVSSNPVPKPIEQKVEEIEIDYENWTAAELDKNIENEWKERNFERSVELAKYAVSKNNSPKGNFTLGLASLSGLGTDQSLENALNNFMATGLEDNKWAQYRIGQILANESYSGYNAELAKDYFIKASENGVAAATEELGKLN